MNFVPSKCVQGPQVAVVVTLSELKIASVVAKSYTLSKPLVCSFVYSHLHFLVQMGI